MLQPWSDFLKMTGIMSIDSLFFFVVDVKCLNPKAIKIELQKKWTASLQKVWCIQELLEM